MNIQPYKSAASHIASVLNSHLSSGEKVLWLIPGGSAIPIVSEVAQLITDNQNITNLSVTLTDERYGKPGHDDENWKKLEESIRILEGADLYPVLSGESGEATARNYAATVQRLLVESNYHIALFGMGADSHIAGIKPHSPSATSTELTSYFIGEDFERVTITFPVILQLDEAFVAATGVEKEAAIHDLLFKEYPINERPAHILRQMPSVTLFTDFIADTEASL